MRSAVLRLIVVAAAFAAVAAPARAAFPGANGTIAFVDPYGINVIAPDGTGHAVLSPTQSYQREPAWSPDGKWLAFSAGAGRKSSVGVMRADGSDSTILAEGDQPAWSPDGQWLAFSRYDTATATRDVWIMRRDGTDQRRLTFGAASERSPAWSPDGKRIAFVTNRDLLPDGKPNIEIYSMNTDGTDQVDLTKNPAADDHPNWSPDGSSIAFDRDAANAGIWTMNGDGGGQTQLTRDRRSRDPAWSPDGASIVYSSDKDDWGPLPNVQAYRLFVMAPDGTLQRIVRDSLAPGDSDPDWQPLAPAVVNPPVVNPPLPDPVAGLLRLSVPRSLRPVAGLVKLTAACPAGTAGCSGRVEVRTLRPARCSRRTKALTGLGSATFRLAGGAKKKVGIRMTSAGRRLLACRSRLTVRARITSKAGTTTSPRFTLLRPRGR